MLIEFSEMTLSPAEGGPGGARAAAQAAAAIANAQAHGQPLSNELPVRLNFCLFFFSLKRKHKKSINFFLQPSILTKPRLQELVREIDPTEQLDEEVEEILLQIADDFVENTVNASCRIAKHRKVSKVEVKDVQLYLEQNWNMWIPGFGTDEIRPYKRATITEAHKQRLALIRKAIKKY